MAKFLSVTDSIGAVLFFSSQVEVSPVNTYIVTFLFQDVLITAAGTQEQQITVSKAVGYGFLMRQIECPLRSSFKIEFNLVRLFTLKKYIETCHLDIYTTKQLRLMIERVDTNARIGLVDLYDFDPYHQRAGIGIMIHNTENQKQGFATAAIRLMIDYCFETLGLNQMYSSVPSGNIGSRKLFEKLGFVQTGYRKNWLRRGNGWEDIVYFQLLNQ